MEKEEEEEEQEEEEEAHLSAEGGAEERDAEAGQEEGDEDQGATLQVHRGTEVSLAHLRGRIGVSATWQVNKEEKPAWRSGEGRGQEEVKEEKEGVGGGGGGGKQNEGEDVSLRTVSSAGFTFTHLATSR